MVLSALPAPAEFPLDEIKEFSRGSWSAYLLDFTQRVAILVLIMGIVARFSTPSHSGRPLTLWRLPSASRSLWQNLIGLFVLRKRPQS